MSLQERTLVVKNFNPEKTTQKLLKELCLQAGPVRNVVIRHDHAFVEFDDVESVGFAKALLDGIYLHGKKLILEPKLKTEEYYRYSKFLQDYIRYDQQQRALQQQSLQAFQPQNHILNQAVPWTPNPTGITVYPPQQPLVSPRQYMIPSPPQQMPQLQHPSMHLSYIQTNGYSQPTNFVSPVVPQTSVNFTYNQANNNGSLAYASQRRSIPDPWSSRRR